MSILPGILVHIPFQCHVSNVRIGIRSWFGLICSTSFASQPICARNSRVKLPSDDGHELNSQLIPQQKCLDLQMPEKLEQIFWVLSNLAAIFNCQTRHSFSAILLELQSFHFNSMLELKQFLHCYSNIIWRSISHLICTMIPTDTLDGCDLSKFPWNLWPCRWYHVMIISSAIMLLVFIGHHATQGFLFPGQ